MLNADSKSCDGKFQRSRSRCQLKVKVSGNDHLAQCKCTAGYMLNTESKSYDGKF